MDCSTIIGGHATHHHHRLRRFQPCIVTPSLLQLWKRNHRSIRYQHHHHHHHQQIMNKQSTNPPFWNLSLSASMNGCSSSSAAVSQKPLQTIQTRTLNAVSNPSTAFQSLFSVLAHLRDNPPLLSSGIIRFQVPIQQQICAIDWLHSQGDLLPRFYFSGRDRGTDSDTQLISPNGGSTECNLISIAGVGVAVYFRSTSPFGIDDWRSIRRFLSKESPLIRAYGAIRFDASTDASAEWEPFGSYYFMIPQIEFDELEGSAMIAATVAWDDDASHTWESATEELQKTMCQISFVICNSRIGFPKKRAVSYEHIPSKALWEHGVERALQFINKNDSSLIKVVLARSSMILTSTAIDPIRWLACLQAEGANAYQFCLQPPDSSAFIGNTPECLFHRRKLSICSEALAGTRARGKSHIQDVHIEHDLLSSPKDHLEFSIVQSSIQSKLEAVCSRLMVVPQKSIRKLSRVQHLYVKLAGTLHSEDNEFDILSSLHPSPAVCGFPTEEARRIIAETEVFDRGMYAGPVGWFGGEESEFAVGIRSALVDKGHGALLYAGTGIVKGSNPSQEWDELELKTSQFTNLIEIQALLSEYQESHH